jgi:hypothetical protein
MRSLATAPVLDYIIDSLIIPIKVHDMAKETTLWNYDGARRTSSSKPSYWFCAEPLDKSSNTYEQTA